MREAKGGAISSFLATKSLFVWEAFCEVNGLGNRARACMAPFGPLSVLTVPSHPPPRIDHSSAPVRTLVTTHLHYLYSWGLAMLLHGKHRYYERII